MKLVYKCMHCDAAIQYERHFTTLDKPTDAFDALAQGMGVPFAKWIRHPCKEGVNGFAHLVAIND